MLVFEKKTIILDGIRGDDADRRSDVVALLSFGIVGHGAECQAARVPRYRMVSSLAHPVGRRRIELLLAHLSVAEGLVLVLLLRRHLRLWGHTCIRFRHAVDVLTVQEVIHDLVTVLIARRLAVVRAQDVHPLIWLGECSLWHHDRARLAERAVLHGRLHPSSMLALYSKTRYGGPFLMVEVHLLLAAREASHGHALTWLTECNGLWAAGIPGVLRRHELTCEGQLRIRRF